MSNYVQITKHPQSGDYEQAEYRDNYFGSHVYGIKFPSDERVWPVDYVEKAQIYDFWVGDVVNALRVTYSEADGEAIVAFLNEIQRQYKLRWEKDPITGNGATKKSRVVYDVDSACDL